MNNASKPRSGPVTDRLWNGGSGAIAGFILSGIIYALLGGMNLIPAIAMTTTLVTAGLLMALRFPTMHVSSCRS